MALLFRTLRPYMSKSQMHSLTQKTKLSLLKWMLTVKGNHWEQSMVLQDTRVSTAHAY